MYSKVLKWASIAMILFAVCACSDSKTEKMLDGVWVGTQSEVDDDGDAIEYELTLTFDKKDMTAKIQMKVGYPQLGDIATVTMYGDWEADKEEITYYFDEDRTRIDFTDEVKAMSRLSGISVSSYENMLEESLKDEIGLFDTMKIYSLSDTRLKVDFDGPITLTKQ